MLRSFLRQTSTPERAAILIRLVDLIEKTGYLNMIDTLEAVLAADPQGQASDLRDKFETTLGDVVEAIYSAHSITISYDRNLIEEITQHLDFLLYFNTPGGYTPDIESAYDLCQLGEDGKQILANLYDESGHNLSGEPCTWIDHVGLLFINRLGKLIEANAAKPQPEEPVHLIVGQALEDLKKFSAVFPDSMTVKHIQSTRGAVGNINELLYQFADRLGKLGTVDLGIEILGLAIISDTPANVTKATYAKSMVESVAGQGTKAIDVVNAVVKAIEKAGLK